MRILEHFFPDRELNLHTLRSIAKDVTNGTLSLPVTHQSQTPSSQDQASNGEEEDSPLESGPIVESVNDLHEPLGCLMKDSQGRYRRYYQATDLTIKNRAK
jgi:aldehyde dehydrogenase (NAD+)